MKASVENALTKLTNAVLHLSKGSKIIDFFKIIVEETMEISYCDLSSIYICKKPEDNNNNIVNIYKKGKFNVPKEFKSDNLLIDFIKENRESVVLLEKKDSLFINVLLNYKMQSGIALPLINEDLFLGVLILNSILPYHFNRKKIKILDSFMQLAGEIFNYKDLKNDLSAYFKKIIY